MLGQGATARTRAELLARYGSLRRGDAALRDVERFWDDTLGARAGPHARRLVRLLVNRWLLYQTLSCRIWARSGFYQPGGAFGFRDQLQDVLALLHARPDLCRAHLLRAARGSSSKATSSTGGIRRAAAARGRAAPTTCCGCPTSSPRYVAHTGDAAVLDEPVPFLEAPPLEPDQHEAYDLPSRLAADGDALRSLRPRDRPRR